MAKMYPHENRRREYGVNDASHPLPILSSPPGMQHEGVPLSVHYGNIVGDVKQPDFKLQGAPMLKHKKSFQTVDLDMAQCWWDKLRDSDKINVAIEYILDGREIVEKDREPQQVLLTTVDPASAEAQKAENRKALNPTVQEFRSVKDVGSRHPAEDMKVASENLRHKPRGPATATARLSMNSENADHWVNSVSNVGRIDQRCFSSGAVHSTHAPQPYVRAAPAPTRVNTESSWSAAPSSWEQIQSWNEAPHAAEAAVRSGQVPSRVDAASAPSWDQTTSWPAMPAKAIDHFNQDATPKPSSLGAPVPGPRPMSGSRPIPSIANLVKPETDATINESDNWFTPPSPARQAMEARQVMGPRPMPVPIVKVVEPEEDAAEEEWTNPNPRTVPITRQSPVPITEAPVPISSARGNWDSPAGRQILANRPMPGATRLAGPRSMAIPIVKPEHAASKGDEWSRPTPGPSTMSVPTVEVPAPGVSPGPDRGSPAERRIMSNRPMPAIPAHHPVVVPTIKVEVHSESQAEIWGSPASPPSPAPIEEDGEAVSECDSTPAASVQGDEWEAAPPPPPAVASRPEKNQPALGVPAYSRPATRNSSMNSITDKAESVIAPLLGTAQDDFITVS